jgi:hypothetical protein
MFWIDIGRRFDIAVVGQFLAPLILPPILAVAALSSLPWELFAMDLQKHHGENRGSVLLGFPPFRSVSWGSQPRGIQPGVSQG